MLARHWITVFSIVGFLHLDHGLSQLSGQEDAATTPNIEHKDSGDRSDSTRVLDAGTNAVVAYLAKDQAARRKDGGHFHNPTIFRGTVAHKDSELSERFAVVSRRLDPKGNFQGFRFGLEDESIRLNLAMLLVHDVLRENGGRSVLLALPGMTVEIADAILDWIDADDMTREFGAEGDYYANRPANRKPRNGPVRSIEELLSVRGVTPELLYGLDKNRNGLVDADERKAAAERISNYDDSAEFGWSAYLTLHSGERNVSVSGRDRININDDDLAKLYREVSLALNEDWAKFIVTYRQFGPYDGRGRGIDVAACRIDLTLPGSTKFKQVLDLVGAKGRVVVLRLSGAYDDLVVAPVFPDSPQQMAMYLPLLRDAVTVTSDRRIPGRINIFKAQRPVLAGIPGLDKETMDSILRRRSASQGPLANTTSLLTEQVVTLDEMRSLARFINAGGDVFSARIIGHRDEDGSYACRELVVDASHSPPKVIVSRDLPNVVPGERLQALLTQNKERQPPGR